MAPDGPTDERDQASTPGASPAAPAGTTAVVVYSDPRCPWARVAVRRLLDRLEQRGLATELAVDHRWFPLGDDAMPADGDALDSKLEPLRSLEPDAGWHRWSGAGTSFPDSSELAAAWIQAAKRVSPAASTALDRALREALFAEGRDISDEDVLAEVAASVPEVATDVDLVRSEVASGRPQDELERHAELAGTDLVPASPTIVLTDGTTWTNPGIEFRTDDGVPVIEADEPTAYGDIVDAFLALRHYD
jgi:predicted DsbA family dithiol-disulfide isomerase